MGATKTAINKLVSRPETAPLWAAAGRATGHPGLIWRAHNTRHEQRNTREHFQQVAVHFGVKEGTLKRVGRDGLDNVSYRFDRDAAFFNYFDQHRATLGRCSWLDVGADSGCVDLYLSDILGSTDYSMCDVRLADKRVPDIEVFDGHRLAQPDNSVDLVFFSYVLHHAADDTIQLLRDAARIARRHVIVLEDPKETSADYRWAAHHDPAGTFRGLSEWRELFDLLGFAVEHDVPLGSDVHSRQFFVLTPTGRPS